MMSPFEVERVRGDSTSELPGASKRRIRNAQPRALARFRVRVPWPPVRPRVDDVVSPLADMSEYDPKSGKSAGRKPCASTGIASRTAPNAHLTAEVGDLRPGRALDAGCGHGSDTLWLAARGWQRSPRSTSPRRRWHMPRSTAEAMGPDVAERIDWVEADLATWTPQRDEYDLVVCLYVHVAGPVEEMVQRMATGVARGGTLFLVGHRPIDPATGAVTAAAGAGAGLCRGCPQGPRSGPVELVVADDRPRADGGYRRRCRDPSATQLLTTREAPQRAAALARRCRSLARFEESDDDCEERRSGWVCRPAVMRGRLGARSSNAAKRLKPDSGGSRRFLVGSTRENDAPRPHEQQ